MKQKLLEKLGIVDSENGNESKLSFKHQVVNEKELNNVNHNKSIHTKTL
jgi:hypothetical protein